MVRVGQDGAQVRCERRGAEGSDCVRTDFDPWYHSGLCCCCTGGPLEERAIATMLTTEIACTCVGSAARMLAHALATAPMLTTEIACTCVGIAARMLTHALATAPMLKTEIVPHALPKYKIVLSKCSRSLSSGRICGDERGTSCFCIGGCCCCCGCCACVVGDNDVMDIKECSNSALGLSKNILILLLV